MRLGLLGIIAVAFLALEIVGIALVAGEIGGLRTFLWLLGAALAGGWLIRNAGAGFMPELMQAGADGGDPFKVMWRAGRRFLAGLLLIFPGPVTDGLALLLLLSAGLPRTATQASPSGYGAAPGLGPQHSPGRRGPGDDVIEGEFRRED
jgi:UPF0716 protein FxsA